MAGSRALAANVLALVQADNQHAKLAVAIALSGTTLRYCTGESTNIAGSVYTARAMQPTPFAVGEPGRARLVLAIDNGDAVLSGYAYSQGFTGKTVTVKLLLRSAGAWTAVYSADWICGECDGNGQTIRLTLIGSTSLKPRAGLMEGSRQCWYRFKGANCGYSGSTATCNHTRTACAAMAGGSNVTRYGGYPYAPEGQTTIPVGDGQWLTIPSPASNGGSGGPQQPSTDPGAQVSLFGFQGVLPVARTENMGYQGSRTEQPTTDAPPPAPSGGGGTQPL